MKRKVTALVTHHDNKIFNITFIRPDGESIEMYSRSDDIITPCYNSFIHMYNAVLILARNNGYTIPYHNEFNKRWYNIYWVDTNEPDNIQRYAYQGRYGTF